MTDTPLDVRVQVSSNFSPGRQDKPAASRNDPTKVHIYQDATGIDIFLLTPANGTVNLGGGKMAFWSAAQKQKEAMEYIAGQVSSLAGGAHVTVKVGPETPEIYKGALEAALPSAILYKEPNKKPETEVA